MIGSPNHCTTASASGKYLRQTAALAACVKKGKTRAATMSSFQWMAGENIYPAIRNVILAGRVRGLRTCLTISHMLLEAD
jgi:hypothetical protein